MSNTLAIATVTATLQTLIQTQIGEDIPGAVVKTARPTASSGNLDTPEVNIFLYQITPNHAYRNMDLPNRDKQGRLTQRLQTGVDLYYILSFYGDDQRLVPQRLLADTINVLHENPVLTQNDILKTISNPAFDYLRHSNLADQVEWVKFSPISYSLEELSKLWSVFLQTPYVLSVPYQASVVLIDGKEKPPAGIPVQERYIKVNAFGNGPLNTAQGLALSTVIYRKGLLSLNAQINMASQENDVDYYALYWSADGIKPLSDQNAIVLLPKTGADIVYSLSKVKVPDTATYLLVLTGNRFGVMDHGPNASFINTGLPLQTAQGVTFVDEDPRGTLLGGPVTIYKALDESTIDNYVLYWGSDPDTKLANYDSLVALPKTGADIIYNLPKGTLLPQAATNFIVFTRNGKGEMAYGVSTRIIDLATTPPIHTATALEFSGTIIHSNDPKNPQRYLHDASVEIIRAADERDVSYYNLYWGSSATKVILQPIIQLNADGSNLSYSFPENTPIPSEATCLIVLTGNYYGEMTNGVSYIFN